MRHAFALLGFVFLLNSQPAAARSGDDLPRFEQVNAQVARSGRPTATGYAQLAQKGFKTVISLEQASIATREQRTVENKGLEFFNSPMSAYDNPSDEQIDEVMKYLTDASKQPILVHCLHGEDRTGLIIGLYRVEVEGMAPAQAYQEMLDRGFHPKYQGLVEAFSRRTHWHP